MLPNLHILNGINQAKGLSIKPLQFHERQESHQSYYNVHLAQYCHMIMCAKTSFVTQPRHQPKNNDAIFK